jgi:plasmid maintenance system antidote protein VapI
MRMKTIEYKSPKEYLNALFLTTEKRQVDIAKELGLRPNVIHMVLKGKTKLPPSRAAAFAKALGGDEALMVRLVIEADYPFFAPFLSSHVQSPANLTPKEIDLIQLIRDHMIEVGAGISYDPALLSRVVNEQVTAIRRERTEKLSRLRALPGLEPLL